MLKACGNNIVKLCVLVVNSLVDKLRSFPTRRILVDSSTVYTNVTHQLTHHLSTHILYKSNLFTFVIHTFHTTYNFYILPLINNNVVNKRADSLVNIFNTGWNTGRIVS